MRAQDSETGLIELAAVLGFGPDDLIDVEVEFRDGSMIIHPPPSPAKAGAQQ